MIQDLISDFKRYKPQKWKVALHLLIWLIWSGAVHYAWLSKWYLYPVTAILLSPNLIWLGRRLIREAYEETLDGIKLFYELLAAQIGCGLSLSSGITAVIYGLERDGKLPDALKGPLEQLDLEIKIGLFSEDSLKPLAVLSQVPLLERGTDMIGTSLKTGIGIENLMVQFAELLSELLKFKREFVNRLAQKRGEFHIMMLMPLFAIVALRNMAPEYFVNLYQSGSGLLLLLVCTGVYSFSCHMFYKNEHRMLLEEG